jgi:hypothetical protein
MNSQAMEDVGGEKWMGEKPERSSDGQCAVVVVAWNVLEQLMAFKDAWDFRADDEDDAHGTKLHLRVREVEPH